MKRSMYEKIWRTLAGFKQMIFIAGPRQAGKTTFTQMLAEGFTNSLYFNWDILDEKRKLIENPSFYEEVTRKDNSVPLIIFDELHKYGTWKNYLKGVYDRDKDNFKFIVSGSGRLDIYQKGGDSLAGRYLLFYLWPFTLAELAGRRLDFASFMKAPLALHPMLDEPETIWKRLTTFSGFPDPYLEADENYHRIWSNNYRKQLLREDLRDLTSLRSIDNVEILFSLVPSRVGSPLSMASLARDLRVSFDSVKKWLLLFERFFMTFSLSPWTRKVSRAITKERKVYLYDYAVIGAAAAKFENMVALELWRAVTNWNDLGLGDFSLHFIRNREKEEVDFLIADKNSPVLMIEAKLSDDAPAKSLKKFQTVFNIPAVQLVNKAGICKSQSNGENKILVISAAQWLSLLP